MKKIIKKALTIIIPKKHLGIILSIDLNNTKHNLYKNYDIEIIQYDSLEKILDANKKIGTNLQSEYVKNLLEQGGECWFALYNKQVIGCKWILYSHVFHESLSGRIFTKSKIIKFNNNVGYVRHAKVISDLRGKGFNSQFVLLLINEYRKRENIKKLISTTGADNGGAIRSWMKVNAQLIGIVKVTRIFGWITRKEYFIDKKEKCWE